MAGIGQVEHIVLFLGIKHQGILVCLLHRQQQLGDKNLGAFLTDGST